MHLSDIGWDDFFKSEYDKICEQDFIPLRITRQNKTNYLAVGENGEFLCEISGKYRYLADENGSYPCVGDWVAASTRNSEGKATINYLLPRKSAFTRKAPGEITEEQVVASNIDTVFIVCGLDLNYKLRRIERYLALAWESGAIPVILLNKADICYETEQRKEEVESISNDVEVITLSAIMQNGLQELDKYFQKGKTVAFLGSSGVGKSTIINKIIGEERLKVNEVSELGSRGRHTTTFRELILLPSGGMVIDTPGMRELQVWGNEDGLKHAFEDIEELALNCRFGDCTHSDEPGCAIQSAIENGDLDLKRFQSFLKLKREFQYLADRQVMKASAVEKKRWKDISKLQKYYKNKD